MTEYLAELERRIEELERKQRPTWLCRECSDQWDMRDNAPNPLAEAAIATIIGEEEEPNQAMRDLAKEFSAEPAVDIFADAASVAAVERQQERSIPPGCCRVSTPEEIAEMMAKVTEERKVDRTFDPIGDIRQGLTVPATDEEAAEYLLSNVKPPEPPAPEPRKPWTGWAVEFAPRRSSVGTCYQVGHLLNGPCDGAFPVREVLPGEEDCLEEIDKWREWLRSEKARSDEYLRDLECEQSRRREAEKEVDRLTRQLEFERDCISEARKEVKRLDGVSEAEQSWRMEVERDLATTKDQMAVKDAAIAQLRADIESLMKTIARLSELRDRLTAEKCDALTEAKRLRRQLAIAVECLRAISRIAIIEWCRKHNLSEDSYGSDAATRCLEMIEEV